MKIAFEHTEMKHGSYTTLEISPVAGKDTSSFVGKLSAMLGDLRAKEHIHWSACGESIVIPDPGQFSRRVLPMCVLEKCASVLI